MRFGFSLIMRGKTATPEAFFALAQQAETLGYDSLWCSDHIFFPTLKETKHPHSADGQLPQAWRERYWECFTVLNQVAARTQRISLGTSVLILPMHHPIEVAKQVASLDQFCGGRFVFGVGVGWLKEEFDALGWPFHERGARTDEGLELCLKLWSEERPSHQGRFYAFDEALFFPKPLRKPPIWIGGHSPAALKRIARFGDVWHPFRPSYDLLTETLPRLRRLLEAGGRRPDSVGVAPKLTVTFQDVPPQPGQDPTQGRPQDILEAVKRYRDLGATELVLDYKPETPEQARVTVDRFAQEVRAKL
jgi:probable F420-dependent oxidoreductase